MGKKITLLFLILLCAASIAGLLIITEIIREGEKQVADGKIRIEKGQKELREGKAKLSTGKLKLKSGKEEYEQARKNTLLVVFDKLLKDGKGFRKARRQIASGEKNVAKGERDVSVGKIELEEGRLEQLRGEENLQLAKYARIIIIVMVIIFSTLSVALGFYWRRPLLRKSLNISE